MEFLRRSSRDRRKRKTDNEEWSAVEKSVKYQKTTTRRVNSDVKTKRSAVKKRNEEKDESLEEINDKENDDVEKDDLGSEDDEDNEDNDHKLDHDDQEMSAYELERLANIKTNEQFFQTLNLHQAKGSLKETLSAPTKQSKTYGLKREKKPKEPPPPRRSSMRLKRMDPLGIPLPELPPEEHFSLSEQFRQVRYYSKPLTRYGLNGVEPDSRNLDENKQRKPSVPLEMSPTNNIEKDVCKKAIQQWLDLSIKCRKKKIVVESDESKTELNEYQKRIQSLNIADNHAAKVTPNRIFALTVHPIESKLLVIAGSKWGRIGIWDVDSKEGQDGVYLFEPHSRPINVVSVCPDDYTKIYSCSYDGTLRCGDLQKELFTEVYAEPEDEDISLNAFAWVAKSNTNIVVGKGDYSVGVIDIRTGKEENNFVAHGKLVRWLDCHPHNENLIATSCQDGSVATWDLRNAKNIKSKLSEISCHRVTSSAFFSPQTGNKILTTSLDNTIRVYDVNSNGVIQASPKCNIRHDNQTGRWLTKFRASWDAKTDDCFVVGSMSRPRAVDFYTSDGKGNRIAQMSHENLSSITSLNVFHPTLNIVAGGNSSGKVFVWQ